MVNITIRGIDDETYSRFSAEARIRSKSIGDLVTQAMKEFLEPTEEIYVIENVMDLDVSIPDLEDLDKMVAFKNIPNLTFSEGIDWKLFSKSVYEIRNVADLTIPKGLSKFQVLTKCKNVGNIKFGQ